MLLILTSNAPDTAYLDLMRNYQQVLSRFVGPTELLISGDTLQVKDYGKLDWESSDIFADSHEIKGALKGSFILDK